MSYANGNCIETLQLNGNVYLLDTKDYKKGPVDVIPLDEYTERYAHAISSGDSTVMFGDASVAEHFTPGELSAYSMYIAAGRLALLTEGKSVIAHENPLLWKLNQEEQEELALAGLASRLPSREVMSTPTDRVLVNA